MYSPWCLPCHATCGVEGKGVLDIEFDRVEQYMSLHPDFLLREAGRTYPVLPKSGSRLKLIDFISLSRMALEKILWQLGLCTIRTDDLCRTDLKG